VNCAILNGCKIKCKKKLAICGGKLFNLPASRQVEDLPPIITHHYVHTAQVVQSCGMVKLVLVDRAAHHSPFWAMR